LTQPTATQQPTAGPRIISVGGSQGGVGTSFVAANLAVAMAQAGKRVVLADLDLGGASLHLLLGLTLAKPGISTLLDPAGQVQEALTKTRIANLKLLAGSDDVAGKGALTHAERLHIERALRGLDADVVILDVGAGVGAFDFLQMGSQRIVVATPQVTSIHEAYSFLKSAVLRTVRHHVEEVLDLALLDPPTPKNEGEKIAEVLDRIREIDTALAEKISGVLNRFGAYLFGNQVHDPSQVGVFQAVSKMTLDHLAISVPILGWLRTSPRVADSINNQSPLLSGGGNSEEARVFRSVADALLLEPGAPRHEHELLPELGSSAPAARGASAPDKAAPLVPSLPPQEPAAVMPPESVAVPAPERVTPRVYVRPPRRGRPKSETHLTDEGNQRRRKLNLPGMPPGRAQK
jgi:flagellar biosynthesis protein FlhG